MIEKLVKVTNKGMISIPAVIRKRHKIVDGDHIIVREEEDGIIRLILIKSVESLRKHALSAKEFRDIYRNSRKEDRELEEYSFIFTKN